MKKWTFVAIAALYLAACAHGPPKQARHADPPWHPATAMLAVYAGPDGSLTRAQMEAGLRRDFAKADTHHDGCLDDTQVRAINADRWKLDASTESPLIDFKNNGCVDFDEYAATPRSLFDQLDTKGTGVLTAKQLKPGGAGGGPQKGDEQHHHDAQPQAAGQ